MKKKYQKPAVLLERYELTQNVAACGWDVNFDDELSCRVTWDPDLTNESQGIGFNQAKGCEWILEGPGQNIFEYCYTNGADDSAKLFRS